LTDQFGFISLLVYSRQTMF